MKIYRCDTCGTVKHIDIETDENQIRANCYTWRCEGTLRDFKRITSLCTKN